MGGPVPQCDPDTSAPRRAILLDFTQRDARARRHLMTAPCPVLFHAPVQPAHCESWYANWASSKLPPPDRCGNHIRQPISRQRVLYSATLVPPRHFARSPMADRVAPPLPHPTSLVGREREQATLR